PTELRETLRHTLPDYMLPSHYVFLDQFPQTPNRKVDRRALPDPVIENTAEPLSNQFTATDETEQQLVNIWKSILGLKRVGIEQNFFDLGGHSLGAARMMVELEKIHGQRLPLAMLLQAPTIRELASLIREQGWVASWRSLVPISPGGSKSPLYCVHAAGGNVLLYRELADHLGEDRPIYGLQSDALAGSKPVAESVEQMAAAYIEEIQKIQPAGPYNLCGYCLGGTIAYEMAQQLQRAGHAVGSLALFDTHGRWHQSSLAESLIASVQRVVFHMKNISLSGRSGVRMFLAAKLSEGRRRILRRIAASWSHGAYWCGLRKTAPVEVLDGIYDQATECYAAQPYTGRLTVFKPRQAYAGYQDPYMGWKELVSDLNMIQLPVYPAGMLLEPFVAELAQHMTRELDACEK
ncbi:MAG: hypothetical protein KDB22_16245, partial [Planctomycetales bacterium]|nr:hypothetical protein [Planctomycetales bacterium]